MNSLCSHRPQYVSVGGTQLRPTEEAIGYLDEVMIVQGGKKLLKTFIAFKLSNENVCAPVPGLAPRGRRRRQMRSSRRFHTSASFEPRVLACGDVFGPVAIACNVVWRATSYIPPPVGVRRLQCHVRPSVSASGHWYWFHLYTPPQAFEEVKVVVLPSWQDLAGGADELRNFKKEDALVPASKLNFEEIDAVSLVSVERRLDAYCKENGGGGDEGHPLRPALSDLAGEMMKIRLQEHKDETKVVADKLRSEAQKVFHCSSRGVSPLRRRLSVTRRRPTLPSRGRRSRPRRRLARKVRNVAKATKKVASAACAKMPSARVPGTLRMLVALFSRSGGT